MFSGIRSMMSQGSVPSARAFARKFCDTHREPVLSVANVLVAGGVVYGARKGIDAGMLSGKTLPQKFVRSCFGGMIGAGIGGAAVICSPILIPIYYFSVERENSDVEPTAADHVIS